MKPVVLRSFWRTLPSLILACAMLPASALAVTAEEPMHMQVFLGELHLQDDVTRVREGDSVYEARLGDIPYAGGAGQVILRDGMFGYGWEGGAFVSWITEDVRYYARSDEQGGYLWLQLDNEFWAVESFMGVYADIRPFERLRLYVSGGPLVAYAVAEQRHQEDRHEGLALPPSADGGVNIRIDFDRRDTDLAAGVYARAGVEFRMAENVWLGAHVRHMRSDMDLEKSLGEFDLHGEVYMVGVTQRF